MWRPRLDRRSGPVYQALAAVIATDVQAGRLAAGERLPPQRDLADALGITVGTVSRAYAEAERAGWVRGEVGRGTFVCPPAFTARGSSANHLDLGTNALLPHAHARELSASLSRLVTRSTAEALFDYQPHGGRREHREVAAAWLRTRRLVADAETTVLTSGAQHAMAVALSSLASPGDVVLCEHVTYTGMRSLANHLRVRLHPVAMDSEGLLPDALEEAAHESGARIVYCIPSGQNPTARVMSRKRREEIARMAARLDLWVVEDDAYGFLFEGAPPLCSLAGDRTFYLTSLSKSVTPGLRVGILRTPAGWTERVLGAVFATTVMGTPLDALAACAWLTDGTADRVMAWKREEVRARQQLARSVLGRLVTGSADSQHAWLTLPARWPADDFARDARQRGVVLSPGREFAVARHDVPNAVRLALGAPPDRETLSKALSTIKSLLDDAPNAYGVTI